MTQSLCRLSVDPEIKQAVLGQAENLIKGVVEIWSIMYPRDDESKWKDKLSSFEHDFNEACQQLYKKEERLKMQLIYSIEEKLKEWSNLEKELGVEMNNDIRDDDPLIELQEELESTIARYRQIKEDRQKRWAILRAEELSLCEYLGEDRKEFTRPVPTEIDLHDMEARIQDLKLIKDERIIVVNPLKNRIQKLLNELGETLDCSTTKSLFSTNCMSFKLTLDNLEKLKDTEKSLLKRREEKIACIDSLKAKLNCLWTVVKEPQVAQDKFLQLHVGLSDDTFHACLEEIRRVEDLVSKNIKKYIMSMRDEIAELWESMDFDTEEKHKFLPFYTTTYTEDVLQIHQIERDKLRDLYNDYKVNAELADKRQILRDRLKLLEEASKNKSRLYNRGGQLLKEEKERKCISSNLPKIEKQLQKSLTAFQNKHIRPFMWRGEDLLEIVLGEIENREKSVAKKRPSGVYQAASPSVQYKKTPTKTYGDTPRSANSTYRRRPVTPLQQPSPFRPYTAPLTTRTPSKKPINRVIF